MRLSTVLALILGLIVLLVGGVAVFLATLDVGRYKADIVALMEDQTGRRVAIDGDLDLSLGLAPALVVEDVHLGNADWAQDDDMVSVGRLEAQVALLPLLSGDLRVVRLVLADAAVWLETDAEGRGNWALGPTDTTEAADTPADPPADIVADVPGETPTRTTPPARLDIQDVRLENAILILRDGARDRTLTLELDTAVLTGAGVDTPLDVDLAGRYNGLAFSAEGTMGALTALGAPRAGAEPTAPPAPPWPLDLTAEVAGATITVNGAIAQPTEARGLDLTVSARGSQIADLAALGPVIDQDLTLPAVGAYDVTLQLTGDAAALAVPMLEASLGTLPLLKATATGSIDNLSAGDGVTLLVAAEGGEVADLLRLPALAAAAGDGQDLPMLGPFRVSATVAGGPDDLTVKDIDLGVGPPEGLRLTAVGAVADAVAASGLDLTVALTAPDPARLTELGIPIAVPVQASAQVSDIDGGYRLADLRAALGRSHLTGDLDARLDGPRPHLSGRLVAPLLDLAEITGAPAPETRAVPDPSASTPSLPTPAPTGTGGATVIPDTPLPLDGLSAVDADLSIRVEHAVLPNGMTLDDVDLGVTLADGALTLDPLRTGVADGTVTGTMTLTPTGNGAAALRVDLTGDGVTLGTLARQMGQGDLVQGGPSRLRLNLAGQGATPRQIAGTLDGRVLLHTVDARLNNRALDWAGADVSTQVIRTINPFGTEEATTPVRCLVVNMTASEGVLSSDHGLALETDRMVVGGAGGFDLGAERLSVKIAPAAREGIGLERGLGRIVELFAVTGPFAAPSLVLDAREAVRTGLRTAASAAGALATGGLSLVGEDLAANLLGGSGAEMEPCLVALGEKEPGQGGGAPAEAGDGSTVDALEDGARDQVDAVREQAEEAIDDLTDQLPGPAGEALGGGLRRLLNQ
ncbi:AsmA family protein [Roseospira visakhapatnamensis]|uniref:Uncharacterized protein involved in outer membrane biogenesis n=1 Tax=Roseospira visakhapatnamensis TaxID=390880 RepID=A0A7W6WAW1_9PROT|nr:AsmA family protein [Roseospira visakhapatnamensis]MBB4267379.1 uncharacterized protein involved in outer membrane biogenesis [Roseospira visakhapatnamensis]